MNPLVVKWEGRKLLAYYDTGGVPTIGYGHTRTVKHSDVGKLRITPARALELLREDLHRFETHVMRNYPGLSYNRGTAITSFIFNCGENALLGRRTQIGKHIKDENWQMVAAGMLYFIKDNGVVVDGLINRRVEEASYIIKG